MDTTVQQSHDTASNVPASLTADEADVVNFIAAATKLAHSSVAPAATPADNLRFDATLNRLMNEVAMIEDGEQNAVAWSEIQFRMHNAHDHKNLRSRPRDRFIDECPHPLMVEIFKKHVGVAKSAKEADTEAFNQRFDERLFARMNDARSYKFWSGILETTLRAKEYKNLRPAVRSYFFTTCPFLSMVEELRTATGCPTSEKPAVESTPAGKPAEEKARKAARASADREARAKMKGKAGQSSEPKGKKAKKKK